jgi:hypothetical protein
MKQNTVNKNRRKKDVTILLGKISFKISWKLNEQSKKKLLHSFSKRKFNYYKNIFKIPQIGYQGCLLNLPPDNIYVFRNVIINKCKEILIMYSDNNRRFEKEILSTAPKNIIPDIICELEL